MYVQEQNSRSATEKNSIDRQLRQTRGYNFKKKDHQGNKQTLSKCIDGRHTLLKGEKSVADNR